MAYTDIDKPSDYFNTLLYTGNGSNRNITGVGFQPDWTWIKCRSNADNHIVTDAVRGANKQIFTNNTENELSGTTSLTAFGSDGFSLGTDSGSNGNGRTFASWNWKAGTSFSNSAGANGASIASTGSISTTAGFSIISYTGNGSSGTIAHGLGFKPDIIFTKQRSASGNNWGGYFSSLGATKDMGINHPSGADADASYWGNTEPTTTVFTVANNARSNASGVTYIAYCFRDVKGYSKFSSYVGNGNADGTFVYTGFKPAWVMTKRSDGASDWYMSDNKRNGFNDDNHVLYANETDVEKTVNRIDILSNGFKLRSTGSGVNASGGSYIYMAFAENPFVTGSSAIPTTAR